jgi:hypothetical protein
MSAIKERLFRLVSVGLASALVFTSLSLPAVAQAAITDSISLPSRLGSITETFGHPQRPQILLIQDLHLHYPTQKRILAILNHLEKKQLLKGPVAVEGVQGDFDTHSIASFPAGKLKNQLVDYFMRKGELSGDEAFAVLRGEGHRLYGVDHADYYRLNRELYKTTLSHRRDIRTHLAHLQKKLTVLKKQHYTRALRLLDRSEIWDAVSAEQSLKDKLALAPDALTRNLIEVDHSLYFLNKLLHQEVTLEEVRYMAQRLPRFVQVSQHLLKLEGRTADMEDVLKAGIDFYAVALMRDQPMAEGTLALTADAATRRRGDAEKTASFHPVPVSPRHRVVVLVAGGFHTAGLTQAFKKAGVSYAVITPHVDEIDENYSALYEARVAGQHVTEAEIAADLNVPMPATPTAFPAFRAMDVASFLFERSGLARWNFAAHAFSQRQTSVPTIRTFPSMIGDKRITSDLNFKDLLEYENAAFASQKGMQLTTEGLKQPFSLQGDPDNSQIQKLVAWFASLHESSLKDANFYFETDVLNLIQERLKEYSRTPHGKLRVMVSDHPDLLEMKTPMVDAWDEEGHQWLVLNGAWVREFLELREQYPQDPDVQLATSWRLGEALRHAVLHKFEPPRDDNDWLDDEVRVLYSDNRMVHKLMYVPDQGERDFTYYWKVQTRFSEKHRIKSVHSGRIYGLTGLHANAFALPPHQRVDFLRSQAEMFSRPRSLRTQPIPNSGKTLPDAIRLSYPEGAHPILQWVKEVGPIKVLAEGVPLEEGEETEVRNYLAALIHGHTLAALDAWRFSAVGHKVGKFGDKVATNAFKLWYNLMAFILWTQAAEGARDEAATVAGRYGMPAVLGLEAPTEVAYANDPVEVTERLQRQNYLANTSIASYALGWLYKRHGKSLPSLSLPDKVQMLGVVGPKGSGVQVDLDPKIWVRENMRRAGKVRGRKPISVRVTGVLLRERHHQLMNDALSVLKMEERHIPPEVQKYFRKGKKGTMFLPTDQVTPFKNYVIESMSGLIVLKNSKGGSLTLVTDGDVMPLMQIGQDADIAFGVGGVAEAMVKTRAEYANIDFEGLIVSNAATKDGKRDAAQVLHPEARDLNDEEMALVKKVGLPVENRRVDKKFGLDDLTGGPYNLSIISSPLGDPKTHESNFVPGLHEVEVLKNGEEVRVTVLVIEPSGRKSLIPIVYATGLKELNDQLSHTSRAEDRYELLNQIGRLYGNLKMYREADRALAMAAGEFTRPEDDPTGMRAYFHAMEELLEQESPHLEKIQADLERAKERHFEPAQMMIEVLQHGQPITVDPAAIVTAIDNLAKAEPEARPGAIDILVSQIRGADLEQLSTVKLFLHRLTEFLEFSRTNGSALELIDRIASALEENENLKSHLEEQLKALQQVRTRLRKSTGDSDSPSWGSTTTRLLGFLTVGWGAATLAVESAHANPVSEKVQPLLGAATSSTSWPQMLLVLGGALGVITFFVARWIVKRWVDSERDKRDLQDLDDQAQKLGSQLKNEPVVPEEQAIETVPTPPSSRFFRVLAAVLARQEDRKIAAQLLQEKHRQILAAA